jgi:hypothetical protein
VAGCRPVGERKPTRAASELAMRSGLWLQQLRKAEVLALELRGPHFAVSAEVDAITAAADSMYMRGGSRRPLSCNPDHPPYCCMKAPTRWLSSAGVLETSSPIVGSFPVCCARAASGHAAAAPPSSVTNSRLFTRSPRRRAAEVTRARRGRAPWQS